jgi:hypothetical protein
VVYLLAAWVFRTPAVFIAEGIRTVVENGHTEVGVVAPELEAAEVAAVALSGRCSLGHNTGNEAELFPIYHKLYVLIVKKLPMRVVTIGMRV